MIVLLPLRPEERPPSAPRVTLGLIIVNVVAFLLLSPGDARQLGEREAELERIADWSLRLPRRENTALDERAQRYPTTLSFLDQDDQWPTEVAATEAGQRLAAVLEDYREIQVSHPFYRYGLVPADLSIRRLILHQFVHADIFHLIFNMLFLWAVGPLVEVALGRWLFLAAYLACGMGAALAHAGLNPNSSEPAIGASGAVAGVMGMLSVLHGRRRMRLALVAMMAVAPRVIFFSMSSFVFIALWLVEQVFFALFGSSTLGVAFGAHLSGFLVGALLALVYRLTYGPTHDLALQPHD